MKRKWKFRLTVAVGILVFLWLVKVPILTYYLSEKLRVPVSLAWIGIWPSETNLRDLKIRNPKGFKEPYAIKIKEGKLDYHLKTFFSHSVTFDKIVLDTVFLEVIFPNPGHSENNWTAISDHMPQPEGSRSVFINDLVLEKITILVKDFGYPGEVTRKYFDRLEFHNISSNRGFPTDQMIHEIFGGVNLGDLIKDAFNPEDLIRNVLDPFRDL